jgi:FixJ family two-component response regulator
MQKTIDVLLLADTHKGAELLVHHLRRSGWDVHHAWADTLEKMCSALDERPRDVILAEYSMTSFPVIDALRALREKSCATPFVVLSGAVELENAIDLMREGADDFILESRLEPRLSRAIERALASPALRVEDRRSSSEARPVRGESLISDPWASTAELVAAIAHDVNNPLASVLANLELACAALDQRAPQLRIVTELSEIIEELQDARQATMRIRDITRCLSAVAETIQLAAERDALPPPDAVPHRSAGSAQPGLEFLQS